MTLLLKDCLPEKLPIEKEVIQKSKPDAIGSRRMLVDYQDKIFSIVLNSDSSVEIIFVYTPLEKYDDRFYRAQDDFIGRFVGSEDEGGYVIIESKKGAG